MPKHNERASIVKRASRVVALANVEQSSVMSNEYIR